eukprot:Em0019g12a
MRSCPGLCSKSGGKVFQLLDENAKAGRLTWHDVIPSDEVWIKQMEGLGVMHNCSTIASQSRFFNISLSQVCLPGLHITLGIFTKIFKLLEDTCHEQDLRLASSSSQIAASSSTFEEYHQEMLRMLSAKEDLTSQIQGLNGHEQLTTSLSIL